MWRWRRCEFDTASRNTSTCCGYATTSTSATTAATYDKLCDG